MTRIVANVIILLIYFCGFCHSAANSTSCDISIRNAFFGDKNSITVEKLTRSCPQFYELHQKDPKKAKDWDLVKVTFEADISSDYADVIYKYPIAITVNAKQSSLSFSLPTGPKDSSLSRREIYLCPNATSEPTPGKRRQHKLKKTRPARSAEDGSDRENSDRDQTHDVEIRSADVLIGDNTDDSAFVAVTTLSPKSLSAKFSLSLIEYKNFRVAIDNDKPVNLTARISDPWIRRVDIPDNVDSVRVKAFSKDDLCATLAIQPLGAEDLKRAYRRLTFTRHGTMVVRRRELAQFFIVIITYPDDKECGSDQSVPGRLNKDKWVSLDVTSVPEASSFALPVGLTMAFFALFYVAVLPIKLAKSLLGGTKAAEIPQPLSIRSDDDALMDASVSRCVSPKPVQADPATSTKLISIDSPTDGSLVDGERGDRDHSVRPNLDHTHEELFGETSGIQPHLLEDVAIPILSRGEAQASGPDGLRHRAAFTIDSAGSDISCVLVRGVQTDGVLDNGQPSSVRSTRWYAWIHTILSGFMLLVVVQMVSWFYPHFVDGGNLDICYYNERCGAPLGRIKSFNHTFSNAGYVALGALALLILKQRYTNHKELLSTATGQVAAHSFGLPTHFGMMTALGSGMIFQGLLSAVYHQCPNASSIQFESISVYLITMLALFKLYGARHDPTEPQVAYGIALGVWTLVTISSIGEHPALWWIPFCLMEMILMPILSLQIYYHGHVKFSTDSIMAAYQSFTRVIWVEWQKGNWKPLFKHRLTALALGNVVNILASIISAVSGVMTLSEYILSGLIINFILYFGYYLANKIAAKEPIPKLTWFYLAAALLFWIPALKYFFNGTMDWKLTAAQSRALNEDCRFFGFYDSHDAWHLLSSAALFFSFMSLLTLDDELKHKRRNEIAVF